MKNKEIARILERIADILEFKGENIFRINAYRKASRAISDLAEDIEIIVQQSRLKEIPGIGKGIARDIKEYLETGKMERYEKDMQGIPEGIFDLLSISGLGPKTVALIYRELRIYNLDQLEEAIKSQKLRGLPGLGPKKEENILRGIEIFREGAKRLNIGIAYPLVMDILQQMKTLKEVVDISPAGSFRRMKETIGDIDILAIGKDNQKIIDHFIHLSMVKEVLEAGETKASIRVADNLQVDLRVVEQESYGAALQYFTGSKDHNVHLRDISKRQGLKINEYGVYRGEEKIGGKTEEEVYASLGLPWIPPEMRENRGEIEKAMEGSLPKLIELKDILGDFHTHTEWSDGINTIEEVIQEARNQGYQYIAITDHSVSVKIAGGLENNRLIEQIEEIRKISRKFKDITVLAGSEVDIKSDGSLDYPDELLKELDIVIASLHIASKSDMENNTRRMIKAIQNPYVNIIAHPTGRMIGERDPYPLNLEEIMKSARETGTVMEINSSYQRLDLNDIFSRRANEMGIVLSIGTDAHRLDQFWTMQLGVGVARRAWITSPGILNTKSIGEIQKMRRVKIKNFG